MNKVSVIISTYGRHFSIIKKAIDSVLHQTLTSFCVYVVNDNHDDSPLTSEIEAGIHEINQQDDRVVFLNYPGNHGACYARNYGAFHSEGEFLAFLDDDDEWLPSKIEKQVRYYLDHPETAFVGCARIDEYDLKQDEVAERVSKSRTTITNSLRLLKLSDKVKQMLIDDMISTGHARALLAIDDENVQYETALSVFDEGLSVRETEQLVKGVNNILAGKQIDEKGQVKDDKTDSAMEAILSSLSEELKTALGSKINIKAKAKKGKIEIEYVSSDDLERIVHIIKTGIANS